MDKQVWRKIIDGDTAAYEKLYLGYYAKFLNYGKKFTADTLLIEDCIHEVFLEIWNKKEKILQIDFPNSYFFAAFRLILLQHLKKMPAALQLDLLEEEPAFMITHSVQAAFEGKQQVQAAMKTLTSRQREAVFLRFYEGLSYEEVAVVLGISVKSTYKIMARSLRSLKDSLSR